ncbi:MAG TPA: cyclic nucleotide-binding domain-containing protein, partial [Woeseiaceae bacterium]|nr:cyclic nucleotide-binding domain-containing protein [Woeseiaceae bacterium]
LGAVLYELLTGFRPFRADNLSKLLHQIVYATPPPIHTYRDDLPEELENVVAMCLQKDPGKRCPSGNAMAADLTRVHKDLRTKYDSLDNQEHFDLLRTLTFFHEFSHAEIWEVLRASDWHEYKDSEDIVREGEMDDRFYIIVSGNAEVEAHGKRLGSLSNGDCFGETSYVRGAKRTASIRAAGNVTILRVSSTLMEQVSSSCQLRFNKVFLRSLITRLQGDGNRQT